MPRRTWTFIDMQTERTEFHRYRTDVLMAHGVEPEAKEAPDVDERDTWFRGRCAVCREPENKPLVPGTDTCEGCFYGEGE